MTKSICVKSAIFRPHGNCVFGFVVCFMIIKWCILYFVLVVIIYYRIISIRSALPIKSTLINKLLIFSCDQAAIWLVQSVRLSVCLSVITMVRSDVHATGQGQRSKVKVTEVNTQLSRFRTLTPVWIHIWQWNHAHSWKQHRRGALLFFKVIRQISRSHGSKNRQIWPRLAVSGL